MEPIKVLIVDDHIIVAEGIKRLLSKTEGIEVLATLKDGDQVMDFINQHPVDVILMDLHMPNTNGIEATTLVTKSHKKVHVIGLSMYDNKKTVDRFMRAGAKGYLLKNTDVDTLVGAIRSCFGGERVLDKNISLLPNGKNAELTLSEGIDESALTIREIEVLKLVAEGFSNKEIARRLFLSTKTVDGHRTSLMRKLDLHSVVGLVKYAFQKKLI